MIQDTHFVWNFDDKSMDILRTNGDKNRYMYSDRFCNNCMVLACCPYENRQMVMGLKMLKVGPDIKSIIMDITFIVYCDNVEIKYEKKKQQLI